MKGVLEVDSFLILTDFSSRGTQAVVVPEERAVKRDATGRQYYVHAGTSTTQWHHPGAAVVDLNISSLLFYLDSFFTFHFRSEVRKIHTFATC